jgi:N-acylneuraminate cytidylyltransferase
MLAAAVIPARGGSKSLPGKNAREFDGKPLITWAIEVAQEVCSDVYVTTDDQELADIAGQHEAIIISRPRNLAMDDTPMLEVMQHAIRHVNPVVDVICLLQPTQPFREAKHILQACRTLDDTQADSVVSVVQIPGHYAPDYAMRLETGELRPYISREVQPTRRQQCRPAYSRDGTVYAIRRRTIEAGSLYGDHCRALIIPSWESVNIDTEMDWQWAEFVRARHG